MIGIDYNEWVHDSIRAVENTIIAREATAKMVARREKRYGYPCLTTQEYRAVHLATYYLLVQRGKQELACQEYVARQMGCSQQWVSKLLSRVDDITEIFEVRDIPFRWEVQRGIYRLNTPVNEMPAILPVIKLSEQYIVWRKAA